MSLFNCFKSPNMKNLCQRCTNVYVSVRYGSTYSRNFRKQEDRKAVVHQYVGLNSKRETRLYGWGSCNTGALGMKTLIIPKYYQTQRSVQLTPLKIDVFQEQRYKVKDISCGFGYSIFVCEDDSGKVFLMGSGVNTSSQIGFQTIDSKLKGRHHDLLIEPAEIFLSLSNPAKTKITHIASGRGHSVIVTDKEGILTLGNNSFGQCGRNIVEGEIFRESRVVNKLDFKETVKQVVCGQDHTLILTEDGRVFGCGLGSDGQTGLGHNECTSDLTLVEGDIKGEKIVSISSKSDTVLAVSDKGDLFGWGNTEYDQLEFVCPKAIEVNTPKHISFQIGKITHAAAAGSMCAVVNEDNKVFTWGYGILGRGPNVDRCYLPGLIPPILFSNNQVKDIQCGLDYFAVVTEKGNVYTWGRNNHAALGLAHIKDQYFPWQAQIPAEVLKVFCGVDHAMVLARSFS